MTERLESAPEPALPYLEHFVDPANPPERVVLAPLPFRIGRSRTANFVIHSRQVSGEHTEIYLAGNRYHVRDLGSTNGTFVNGEPVQDVPLAHDDIIHLANAELRFCCEPLAVPDGHGCMTERAERTATRSVFRARQHLHELLLEGRVRTVFQPIVFLVSGRIMGYEALGRGTHPDLTASPEELLRIASECNLACKLSEVFRTAALQDAARLPERAYIFVNAHPAEMGSDSLVESLAALKAGLRDDQRLVVELHEAAVTDPHIFFGLRQKLSKLEIGLAYDDFGAGQSRLKEFADAPPDFVKLDMSMIRDIQRLEARQDLVRALVRFGNDLGVGMIAEGIETAEEAALCQDLGCHFGQGYLFGRPESLEFTDGVAGNTPSVPDRAASSATTDRR
jgi:EAL domain-containing protein (putative c-di-GMP-specific phosphodiesterase class I)